MALSRAASPSETRKNVARRAEQVVFSIVLTAALLFVPAGTLRWPFAWAYLGSSVAIVVVNSLLFPSELIAERGKKKEDVEPWDVRITRSMLVPWFALFVIAGLDRRFAWTPSIPAWISLLALVLFVLGSALVSWAMMKNHFFSTAVRIQYERGHAVCSSGPYRFLRHPGYLGMIGYQLVSPLVFGSLWALIPAALTALLFVVRTAWEDRTLQEKLPGYRAYAERVRWKLFPGVW